jgi:glycerol uptake facilitator-like aquaporin
VKSLALGPALMAEAIGTFALVFAGCGAIAVGTLGPVGVAAAFGLAIMTMVYAFGHVSGAHFNPAVTAGFAAGRHFPMSRVPLYWSAQVGGASAAAGLPLAYRPSMTRPRFGAWARADSTAATSASNVTCWPLSNTSWSTRQYRQF